MADNETPITPEEALKLEPLKPLDLIVPHIPVDESSKDVTGKWFKTETMELNFGESQGRPSASYEVRREVLSQLFQQGWFVTEVKASEEDGEWQKVSSSSQVSASSGSSQASSQSSGTATQHGNSSSTSDASSRGSSSSDSQSNTYANTVATNNSSSGEGSSSGSSSATNIGNGSTSSTGENANNGTETATGESSSTGTETATGRSEESSSERTEQTSETSEGGSPYWTAYNLIRLQRRRMQAENVLDDMVGSFVAAYNEGRKINIDRYDELVKLYALMLSNTENELNDILKDIDLKPLFDEIEAAIKAALDKFEGSLDGLPDDWMQSRIDDINAKFNALLGQRKAEMVTNGLYNTTVWSAVSANVEKQRAYALNNLRDDMVTLKVETYGKIAQITAGVGEQLISAKTRIFEALQKQKLTPVDARNGVFKWMLEFMERRKDEYPTLTEIPAMAQRMGYEGGTGFVGTGGDQ